MKEEELSKEQLSALSISPSLNVPLHTIQFECDAIHFNGKTLDFTIDLPLESWEQLDEIILRIKGRQFKYIKRK